MAASDTFKKTYFVVDVRFEVDTTVAMKSTVSGLGRSDVSGEHFGSIYRIEK
jgi:hypothetical protein